MGEMQTSDFIKGNSDAAPAYVNGVSEDIFKVGMCLPAGPYVSDEDVQYIVETIKEAMEL
jgi:dTDP-4-amino-4,6-dideoxygalactose transaminase